MSQKSTTSDVAENFEVMNKNKNTEQKNNKIKNEMIKTSPKGDKLNENKND